jgi:ABC-type transporter MlaC component
MPITRRNLLLSLAALGFTAKGANAATLPEKHPAMAFVRKATEDLFNAHRQGTVQAFLPAIKRNADIAYIGDYSLGQYEPKLPKNLRDSYYDGVTLFMARYFAEQTRTYRVAKWDVGQGTEGENGNFIINSRVTLLSGPAYDVSWTVAPRGKGFKFIDAQVMIFSLTYAQRGLFVSYLQKHDGDLEKLVTVLNRK